MLLAKKIGETCTPCRQAPQILCFLSNDFWNSTGGYLTADLNVNNVNRSGINSDIILGSIHVFDINATCDAASESAYSSRLWTRCSGTRTDSGAGSMPVSFCPPYCLAKTPPLTLSDFQPCNSKVLATHKVLVDSFRKIYPINKSTPNGSAVAIGRYPEDTYYKGNPWYLCTLAAAELLYDAVAQFNKQGHLTIDSTNQAFFKDIHPPANLGSHTGNNMKSILDSMTNYADGFVSVVEVGQLSTSAALAFGSTIQLDLSSKRIVRCTLTPTALLGPLPMSGRMLFSAYNPCAQSNLYLRRYAMVY
jgi:glucoamylase